MKQPAAFAVVFIDGKICATTREDGTIGLPGGKLDDWESPIDAAYRESREEGWDIPDSDATVFLKMVYDDRLVTWILMVPREGQAVQLEDYKEKHRGIRPILVTPEELIASKKGNATAIPIAVDLYNHLYK